MTNFWAFVNVCSYHNKTVRDRILKKNILGYNVMFQYFHKYCFTLVLWFCLLCIYLNLIEKMRTLSINHKRPKRLALALAFASCFLLLVACDCDLLALTGTS